MDDEALTRWVFKNGGPILRYRTWIDLLGNPDAVEGERLLAAALETPEVQRWLANLRQARQIHGSRDTEAENAIAKLLEYGLNRHVPELDRLAGQVRGYCRGIWDHLTLFPFLIRAGYANDPVIAGWFKDRLELLYRTAVNGDFHFYLTPEEAAGVPKAWQGKPIYRDEYGSAAGYPLPTCYDFYALGHCPPIDGIANQAEKMEAVVDFLSDPRFQGTVGGYGWDRKAKRCYAAGRVFLACTEPARLVLFLELGARFPSARRSAWFQAGLAQLESHRTPQGYFQFPAAMLVEKPGYYLYGGSHMGLGENRRSELGLALESTFRMLTIRRRMQEG